MRSTVHTSNYKIDHRKKPLKDVQTMSKTKIDYGTCADQNQ